MSGDVEEEMGELRCRVLRAVRRRKARDQHHRLPGEIVFALPKENHAVVGYQIRIVVPAILKAVLYLPAVHIYAVVVIARVHYKAAPFSPPRRYVRAIVLVQILAEVS